MDVTNFAPSSGAWVVPAGVADIMIEIGPYDEESSEIGGGRYCKKIDITTTGLPPIPKDKL